MTSKTEPGDKSVPELPVGSVSGSRRLGRPQSFRRMIGQAVMVSIALYLILAYWLLPDAWRTIDRRAVQFAAANRLTRTGDGHPGDPINLAVVGSESQLRRGMRAAGWFPADPLSLRNDVKIAVDSVLGESFAQAPVSNLFYYGRKEDMAFEMPVGDSPKHRHHVRFWKAPQPATQGEPVWYGSATYDERIGLSYTTGQVTHHIAPDVDRERDHVIATLTQAEVPAESYFDDNFHSDRTGYNGGGDPWRTDGRLGVVVLR